jgi:hypothetical protein
MLLAPVLSLVSALCATAAVKPDAHGQILAIQAGPTKYYVYAITQLVAAYLLVPAFTGLKNLMRPRAPRWADLAGGALILGLLIAIGDSASELFAWQAGAPGSNVDQMAELLDRYNNASGSALVYAIGGILIMISTVVFTIGLCRTRTVPIWAAVCIAVSLFANIFGYASGNQALLVASAVALLVGFGRVAPIVLRRPAAEPAPAPAAHEAAAFA